MFDTAATSPGLTRPADRRRAETRREILDHAWAACREHGLAGLALRDLATRMGMRAPSLYSYFASKDAIYDAMFAQGQLQLLEALGGLDDSAASVEEFRRGNRIFFEFCVADPVRYQLMFQRTLPGFEPSAESYALARRSLERLGGTLAAMGATDPRHVDLWTAIMTGLTSQQLANDPGGDRWGRLLDDAMDLFLRHAGLLDPAPRKAPR